MPDWWFPTQFECHTCCCTSQTLRMNNKLKMINMQAFNWDVHMTVVQIKQICRYTLEDDVKASIMQCRVLCGGDTPASITMWCMHQHPWELLLTTSIPSLSTISKWIWFQTSVCCTATNIWRSWAHKLTITNICFIEVLSKRTIVTRFASVTVDAIRVVSTVLAYATSLIVTMDV